MGDKSLRGTRTGEAVVFYLQVSLQVEAGDAVVLHASLDNRITLRFMSLVIFGTFDQVDYRTRDLRVGTPLQQNRHRTWPIRGRGEDQGRVAPLTLRGVHIRAFVQEGSDSFLAARCGREVEGSHSTGRRERIGLSTCRQQHLNQLSVAFSAGQMQWRVVAEPSQAVDAGTGIEKDLGDLGAAVLRRPVERRHPVSLRSAHVGALSDQSPYALYVVVHGGVGNRRLRRGEPEDP